MTRFEQFQQNVQRWATERGIYEHSTALAQALKAVSEVGELCDAVIKNDRDALIDAIGDTAVCLVNVGALTSHNWDLGYIFDDELSDDVTPQCAAGFCSYAVGGICFSLGEGARAEPVGEYLDGAMFSLYASCRTFALDFDDCCESAWQTIKHRKGRMVAGGAFVKEGE